MGLDVEVAERRTRGDPLRLARRRFSEQEVADMEGVCARACVLFCKMRWAAAV